MIKLLIFVKNKIMNNSNKSLILVRGCPGAGKTEFAELMSVSSDNVISADQYFEDNQGRYKFVKEKIKDAHAFCKAKTLAKMDLGISKIFVTNTFTQEWEMDHYFQLAKKFGYKIYTVIIENRHGSESVHNVPEERVEIMKERFNIKL